MRLYLFGARHHSAFHRAERDLSFLGYTVISAAATGFGETHAETKNWPDCLKQEIGKLLTCDAIATIPGWKWSRFADLLRTLANELELEIRTVDEWRTRYDS